MTNTIGLLRVSTDNQDVQRQRADLERIKTKFGVNVARVLELVGVSGTATLEHSQVQQILKDLELPDIDGIAVSSLDRLFRPKEYGTFAILDPFVKQGKKIWSAREGEINPADDRGFDLCISAGGRAGAEWRELRRRTHDGRIENCLKLGKLDHGAAPDGYTYIPRYQPGGNQFRINPERAEIVRMVFEWRREGLPTYRIAKTLNDRGIRSARGGRWSRQVVQQLLRNRTYKGEHHRFEIMIPCPAIVGSDLWDDVQRITTEGRDRTNGRPAKKPYLLRGMLWCGRCGRRCITHSKGKYGQYRCGNFEAKPPYTRNCKAPGIAIATIEAAAWSAIWKTLIDPALLLDLARAYCESIEQPKDDARALELQLSRLNNKLQNTRAMVQDGLLDYSQGRAEIRSLQDQIKECEIQLRAAGKILSLPPAAAIEAAVREIMDGPEPTTYEGRRGILEGILDLRMVYDSGDLTIEGKIPVAGESAVYGGEKCKRDVDAACTSFASIPFILKKRVA